MVDPVVARYWCVKCGEEHTFVECKVWQDIKRMIRHYCPTTLVTEEKWPVRTVDKATPLE